MSNTPRTDELAQKFSITWNQFAYRDLARQLERELADAKEQLRLCNVDQFTTAAELAEATVKNSLTVQRPWVALTEDEIWTLHDSDSYPSPVEFARAIEAMLRKRNGG